MKTKSTKRLCSLVLASSMALSMAVPAFAAERNYEKELELSITQESTEQPFSNRYYYVTEEGPETLVKTITKSKEQLEDEAERKSMINVIAGVLTVKFAGAGAIASEVIMQAYGYGRAVKVEIYERVDVRYRVDSITGNRTKTNSYDCAVIKLYAKDDSGAYAMYDSWVRHNEIKH